MKHDELCPSRVKLLITPTLCIYCNLISKVRKHERERQFREPFDDYLHDWEGRPL